MKSTRYFWWLDKIAKELGYRNRAELLYDYDFIPTVLTPKHKKIEILYAFYKYIKRKYSGKR